jgi:hypothetical protein
VARRKRVLDGVERWVKQLGQLGGECALGEGVEMRPSAKKRRLTSGRELDGDQLKSGRQGGTADAVLAFMFHVRCCAAHFASRLLCWSQSLVAAGERRRTHSLRLQIYHLSSLSPTNLQARLPASGSGARESSSFRLRRVSATLNAASED